MPKLTLKSETIPVACYAPPLTDELLSDYSQLVEKLPDLDLASVVSPEYVQQVQGALRDCLKAVQLWWELPDSKGSQDDLRLRTVHRGKVKVIKITSLTDDLVQKLWDVVPWPYELDAMQSLFDQLPDNTVESNAVRQAAFHLLWHCKELCLDREPLTQDVL